VFLAPDSREMFGGAKYRFATKDHLDAYLRGVLLRVFQDGALVASGFEAGKELTGKRLDIPQDRWNLIQPDFEGNTVSCDGQVILRGITVSRRSASRDDIDKTGAPGRPSAMHLIEQEFDRRDRLGLVEGSLKREGDFLAEWLTQNHPDQPPTTSKTIQNRLRDKHRDRARN
jgi:hypothetical protein